MHAEEDLAALVDIVTAARKRLTFVEGMEAADFRGDEKTSSAVILQLLIVGEAAKRPTAEFHAEHPELPWSDIVRMRDRLIHHYRKTDLGEVWVTVKRDVPGLLRTLEAIVARAE